MTVAPLASEWITFLSGTHVAVLGVARSAKGPLLAPIWYEYDDVAGFRFVMSADSVKARRLVAEGRATVCVQEDRDDHYGYVIAEGPATVDPPDDEQAGALLLSMAMRYFGESAGRQWMTTHAEPNTQVVTLVPERWFVEDLGNPRGD